MSTFSPQQSKDFKISCPQKQIRSSTDSSKSGERHFTVFRTDQTDSGNRTVAPKPSSIKSRRSRSSAATSPFVPKPDIYVSHVDDLFGDCEPQPVRSKTGRWTIPHASVQVLDEKDETSSIVVDGVVSGIVEDVLTVPTVVANVPVPSAPSEDLVLDEIEPNLAGPVHPVPEIRSEEQAIRDICHDISPSVDQASLHADPMDEKKAIVEEETYAKSVLDKEESFRKLDWMNHHFDFEKHSVNDEELKDIIHEISRDNPPSYIESIKLKFGLTDLSMKAFIEKHAHLTTEQVKMMSKCAQVLDSFENIVIFLYQLYTADSYLQTFGTIQLYLSTLFGSEYLLQKNIASATLTGAAAVIYHAFSTSKKVHAQSLGDDLYSLGSIFSHIMDSGIVKAVLGLLVTAASFKLFQKDVAKNLFEIVGYPKSMSLLETAKTVLDSVARLIKASELWFSGKMTLYEIFMKDDPLVEALAQYDVLMATKEMTYTGLKVEGKKDRVEWLVESSGVLAVLANAISKLAPSLARRIELEKKWAALQVLHLEMIDGSAARPTPIGIVLFGEPSTGKSNLTTAIYEIYSRAVGRKFKPSHVYSKAQSSQYWEGYRGREHPIVFLSEVGSDHKDIAMKARDETISLLTSLLDSNPLQLDMANANAKGKYYFQSELLLIDTNNRDMNINYTKSNPAAYYRRFLWVEAHVKPQYRQKGSMAIDPELCNDGSDWLDKYTFAVFTRRADDSTHSTPQYLMNHGADDDIRKFFNVVTSYVKSFLQAQAAMLGKRYDPEEYDKYYFPPPPPERDYDEKDVEVLDGAKSIDSGYLRAFSEPRRQVVMKPPQDEKGKMMEMLSARRFVHIPVPLVPAQTLRLNITGRISHQFDVFKDHVRDQWNPICRAYSSATHLLSEVRDLIYLSSVKLVTSWLISETGAPVEPVLSKPTISSILSTLFITSFILSFGMNPLILMTAPFFACFNPGSMRSVIFRQETALIQARAQAAYEEKLHNVRVYAGKEVLSKMLPTKWKLLKGFVLASSFVGGLLLGRALVQVVSTEITREKLKRREREVVASLVEEKTEKTADAQSSTFVQQNESTDKLTLFEKETNCGSAYTRVPSKQSQFYNSIVHMDSLTHIENIEALQNRANKNVRRVHIGSGSETYTQFGLLIGGSIMWLNAHAFGEFPQTIEISALGSYDDKEEIRQRVIIGKKDVVYLGNDYVLINLVGYTSRPLLDFFHDSKPEAISLPSKIGKDDVFSIYSDEDIEFQADTGKKHPVKGFFAYKWENSMPGMCGWPLIRPCGSSFVIAGIHGGASQKVGFAARVTRSEIVKARADLLKKSSLMEIYCAARRNLSVEKPIPQSPFCFERYQSLEYYGKRPGPVMAKNVSKLRPTFLVNNGSISTWEDIVGDSPTTIYLPPMLQKTVVDGHYYSPSNYGLGKMSQKRGCVDREVLRKVADRGFDHILQGLANVGVTKLSPLNADVAINGVDYDSFLRRIDASKAAGSGKPGPKSTYIPIVGEIDGVPVREPTELVMKELLSIIEEYKNGNCAGVEYVASFKDEPREKSRALSGNTRLFYISPLTSLILARMFLSPLYTLMVQFSSVFEVAIGADMHRDGHLLWKRLSDFSPLWLEGDYSKFDLVMPFEVKWCTATIIERLLCALGYNESALSIVRGILSDEMFPMVELLKDLFVLPGIQCSGAYATAEKNSFDGLILLMTFWYSHPELTDRDFFDYIKPLLYGDDVLAAVKPEVSEQFNNLTYQKFCKEVYHMDYTPACKKGEMSKFVAPENASFLKRTIRYHPALGRNVCALSMDSLHKTLRWYIRSKDCTLAMQYLSMFNSVLVELFLQVDETVFRKARLFLLNEYINSTKVEIDEELFTYEKVLSLLQSNVIDAQSRRESSAHVSSSAYLYDQIAEFEAEIKEAEEVLFQLQNPMPGLSYQEAIQTEQFFTMPHVQLEVEEYFRAEGRVQGLKDTVSILRRSLTKRLIKTQSKLVVLSQTVEKSLSTIKPLLNPIPRLQLDSGVRIRLFSEIDVSSRYVSAITVALQLYDVEPIDEQSIDTLQGLCAWTLERVYQMDIQWMAWRNFSSMKNPGVNAVLYRDVSDILSDILDNLIELDDQLDLLTPTYPDFASIVVHTQSRLGESETGAVGVEEKQETVQDVLGDAIHLTPVLESPYTIISSTQMEMGKFLERPVQIYTLPFTLNTDIVATFNPFALFFSIIAERAKLKNVGLMRANLVLQFNFSGMPFHSGRAGVTWIPLAYDHTIADFYATNFAAYRPNALKWLSSRAPAYMDPKANQPLVLKLGYVNYQPLWRMYNQSSSSLAAATTYEDIDRMGRLYIYTLNQMRSSLASASSPYMEIYAHLEDVTFGCPTGSAMAITTESRRNKDERKTGPVETVASAVAHTLDMYSSAPVIGPYAKASSMVAAGIAGGAALLGLSYPVNNNFANRVMNEPYQNGAQTIGLDTAQRITLDPKQELTIDLSCCGTREDEMSIAWIASNFGLLDTFTWHATHAPMTVEWSSVVHPAICVPIVGATNKVFQPTPMAFAVSPFAFWRTDAIEFKFMVICNAFVRGKFAVMVDPNIAQYATIASNLSLNKQFNYIVDLQETQEITICVEWMQPRPWLKNTTSLNISTGTGTVTNPTAWKNIANGFIAFVPLTEVQSNDGNDLEVNVFVRAKNLEVNQLGSLYMPTSRVMTQSRKEVEDAPVSCVVINPSAFEIKGCTEHYFGERPISFAALMKRYVTTFVIGGTLATTDTAVTFTAKILPDINPILGNVASNDPVGGHLLSYLRYAYVAMRGGLKKRLRLVSVPEACQAAQVVVTLSAPTTATVAYGVTDTVTYARHVMEGCVSFCPRTNAGASVGFPFYSTNLFLPSGNNVPYDSSDTNFDTLMSRNYTAMFECEVHAATVAYAVEEQTATDEDFRLTYFVGGPPFSIPV